MVALAATKRFKKRSSAQVATTIANTTSAPPMRENRVASAWMALAVCSVACARATARLLSRSKALSATLSSACTIASISADDAPAATIGATSRYLLA